MGGGGWEESREGVTFWTGDRLEITEEGDGKMICSHLTCLNHTYE